MKKKLILHKKYNFWFCGCLHQKHEMKTKIKKPAKNITTENKYKKEHR